MTSTRTLAYGHRATVDFDKYPAAWGARLIYAEVAAGGAGIVWDRTDMFGEDEDRARLLELMNSGLMKEAMDQARYLMKVYSMDSGSEEVFELLQSKDVLVVASPQRSFGYLYITAVLKPDPEPADKES